MLFGRREGGLSSRYSQMSRVTGTPDLRFNEPRSQPLESMVMRTLATRAGQPMPNSPCWLSVVLNTEDGAVEGSGCITLGPAASGVFERW